MTDVLIRKGNLDTETDTHRGKMMGRHREKMIISSKECLRLPEAGREIWNRSLPSAFRGNMALATDFQPPEL